MLLNFIDFVSTLVVKVKLLIISNSSLPSDLYASASRTSDLLEEVHPGGKLLEGPNLRTKLRELVDSTSHLCESSIEFLSEHQDSLRFQKGRETELKVALANIEMELCKCNMQKIEDGSMKIYPNELASNSNDVDHRKESKPFLMRFLDRAQQPSTSSNFSHSREVVSNWSVNEVIVWLEAIQLSEYISSFYVNDISGKELLALDRHNLKILGVTKVGHIIRILQAIKALHAS